MKKKYLVMVALMLSATAGLIYEITATNLLFFYFIESSYSFATVISVFLLGLGIGSFVIYKYKYKIKNKKLLFGVLQIVIGLYAIMILKNLDMILPSLSTTGLFISSFFILLLPTICLGAIFPLAGSIISGEKNEIGLIYSIDLIGAVAGSLIAGFWLIPNFGNKLTILFAVILNFASATLVFNKKLLRIISIIGIVLFLLFFLNSELNSVKYVNPDFAKPSPYGEIIIEDNSLYIDNRVQCSADYTQGEKQIVVESLYSFDSRDLEVLNIGLGCGFTLNEVLERVDNKVDVVEINPVIVEANRLMSDVLKNTKTNLIIGDGFDYLRKTTKTYDSIIIDIENPSVIHSSNIYTLESFEIVEKKLKGGGVFGLWTYPCESQEYYDTIYYTLNEVFGYVYEVTDEIFIASNKELDYIKYDPTTEKTINTLDKKTLSKIYFDDCKWWEEETHILKSS